MKNTKETQRHQQFMSVGDGVQEFLEAYNLEVKYLQNWIKSQWPEIVGNTIAQRTEKLFFKEDKLYVVVRTAALKQQMHMSRTQIKDLVHQKAGRQLVSEVVIL